MAANNAKVYCLGRSKEKTEAAISEFKSKTGNDKVFALICNLQDLQSVQDTAKQFLKLDTELNILVNNAGIYGTEFGLSKQGIEQQFATNYFAHVVLTELLLLKVNHLGLSMFRHLITLDPQESLMIQ